MAAKRLPKFKGRRFTPEPVIVWMVWDALDQEYLPQSWGGDDLDYETAQERATWHADWMEECRPT